MEATTYETKLRISATVTREQKRYLDKMATDEGLRGYGEALRELLEAAIEAREGAKVAA